MENNDKIAKNNAVELNDSDLEKVSGGDSDQLRRLHPTVPIIDPNEDKVCNGSRHFKSELPTYKTGDAGFDN